MPRAIWTGSISFGLVNVPVRVYSATESKDVRFHQFEDGTGRRIDYRRFADGTDREVDYDDIVKGYELDDGSYVMVTPEELESVEPGRSRTIEISDFVELDQIDPIYFEKSYHLAPDGDSTKPYALLREVMLASQRVAIGCFVMRTKQYLAAIRPSGDVLVLETMFFGDEVRDPGKLDLPGEVDVPDRELKAARQLVDSLTVDFDPSAYEDTYRARVLELIESKAKGETVEVRPAEAPSEPAEDLMAALEASIADIQEARGKRSSGARGRKEGEGRKKPAARKKAGSSKQATSSKKGEGRTAKRKAS